MTLMPFIFTESEFADIVDEQALFDIAVDAIVQRHGLGGGPRRRYGSGSMIVYAIGHAFVVKLFPPIYGDGARTESLALEQLQGRLSVETPRLAATGEIDGWPYVVMSQLPGQDLASVWTDIPPANRTHIAREVGELLAQLHALPTDGLGPLTVDWPAWAATQRDEVVARQRALGASDAWVEQIPAFLDRVDVGVGPRGSGLLHTEIMREHLKVCCVRGRWRLCGLFDFEPAMVGPVDYEFASVGLFVARGERGLMRPLLEAYGIAPHAIDDALSERFLAMTLLHRYCNLKWYLGLLPSPEGQTLEALARAWWDTAEASASAA